jgi:endonuclease/exonuclease/phosphatase family metal-dependent hydrolase
MATIEQAREPIPEADTDGIEIDSFAPPDETKNARPTLVIASYNIRYAVGSFLISGSISRRLGLTLPARRPRLVARNLRKAAEALSDGRRLPPADIVALQETDKLTARAGRKDIARELARELQMHYARVAAASPARGAEPKSKQWYLDFEEHISPQETGDTGIAILSRLPFESPPARIDLPWSECEWRPRLALASTIENGKQNLHIINSHIDPHAAIPEQLEQHAAILARTEDLSCPVILLGDFNTLSRRSCHAMRLLLESKGFKTPFPTGTATWRAGLIRLHTDWIFVRGAEVRRWGVARLRGVSDHWPVWIEIDLTRERTINNG